MFTCLVSFSLTCFWGLFPLWAQVLIIIGAASIVIGIALTAANTLKNIGGAPAFWGAILVIVTAIASIFIGKSDEEKKKDEGIPKPPRETIFDVIKNGPGKTKRKYNPDTNKWE